MRTMRPQPAPTRPTRPTRPAALYASADLRQVERLAAEAIAGDGTLPLMERAGRAAADLAVEMLADRQGRVLVFAGPGNNGGDALVAARLLREAFFPVDLVLAGDPARLPPDAAGALVAWRAAGGSLLDAPPQAASFGLVIDGLFGIGLHRAPEGMFAAHVEAMASLGCNGVPVLALDIPSGLDADTGEMHGLAVSATRTLGIEPLRSDQLIDGHLWVLGQTGEVGPEITQLQELIDEHFDLSEAL